VREDIGLTIVAPKVRWWPGCRSLRRRAPRLLRPSRAAARLEGSKAFTKNFLERHRIPTAGYAAFTKDTFDPPISGRSACPWSSRPTDSRRQGRRHLRDP